MKRIVILFFIAVSPILFAQPIMDGTFDGESVWGTPVETADGTAGWSNANAKKLYVTYDNNYIYFGAEITSSTWMAWAFILNSQVGGGSTDSWSRNISYNHTNLPDFSARGHFNGYAEIYKWTGSVWQRDPDSGLDSSEFGENITGENQDGWVEIRVPKSLVGVGVTSGDVQFYITGDKNQHGSFDACPDDDNATGWDDHTTLQNYAPGVPLPVELTSFTAFVKDGVVTLNWQTATEVNNYGFDIERKTGTNHTEESVWENIGFVEGHGNSNSTKSYVFTDNSVSYGSYLYRLKQIDTDGSYEYSNTVEVFAGKFPEGFILEQNYPNPFNPVTSIRFGLEETAHASLKVYNSIGKEVATLFDGRADAGKIYDVSFSADGLSSGVYLYKLSSDKFTRVMKMIIMK